MSSSDFEPSQEVGELPSPPRTRPRPADAQDAIRRFLAPGGYLDTQTTDTQYFQQWESEEVDKESTEEGVIDISDEGLHNSSEPHLSGSGVKQEDSGDHHGYRIRAKPFLPDRCSGCAELVTIRAYVKRLEREYAHATRGLSDMKEWMVGLRADLCQLLASPEDAILTCDEIRDLSTENSVASLGLSISASEEVSEESQRAFESGIDRYNEATIFNTITMGFSSSKRRRTDS